MGLSIYTAEIADALVEWISSGKTLREFCRQEGMPNWRTVYLWRETQPEFDARIVRARDLGHDAIAEEALQIADTPMEGIRTESSEDGIKTVTEDMLGHRKLQIETRLKLLAKWSPKKYGDRLHTELTGPNGGPIEMAQKAAAALSTSSDPNEAAAVYGQLVSSAGKVDSNP